MGIFDDAGMRRRTTSETTYIYIYEYEGIIACKGEALHEAVV